MTSEKKLVYTLTTSYSTPKTKEHFVFFEDKSLIDGGFRVETITPHQKDLPSNEILDSVSVHRFRYLPEKYEITSSLPDALKTITGKIKLIFLSLGFLFTTFFKCWNTKPDIILAHWAVPCGVVAYFMYKIFKINYVVSIHGGDVAPLKNSSVLRNFVVNLLNHSSYVIVNGGFTKNEFIKMGVNEKKITVIFGPPNYVRHTTNNEILNKFKSKFTNLENKIILTVTRLTELKGNEFLVKALSKIKYENFHCIVVGSGELLDQLKNMAHSLKISEKITFYGRANYEELGYFYDISDIFVLSSIIDSSGATDAMPLVIPEAMESKIPVIGTNVGGIPFMIEDKKNGIIVEQKNSNGLATAIDLLLSNEELCTKLVQNSQTLVNQRTLQSTHDMYIEIIKKSIRNT